MFDPYKMVVVNIFTLLLVGGGLLFYRYKYPKKKINLFAVLLALSVLPLVSLLRVGTYESGDLSQNVYKSMEFYRSLLEGNVFPQWAGELNATYGYPLFIFIYPLPYYLVSFFHFIGFSFIASLKLFIAVSFIASGVGMYLWIKEELNQKAAFVAAIFYLYAPYHLVDIHYRISIGEIASFAILPFALLASKKLLDSFKLNWFLLFVATLFLLILSNQAIALIAFLFICIYIFFTWMSKKKKTVKELFICALAFISALLLSAFYWLPVIVESQFTHQAQYVQKVSFTNLKDLLYTTWRYGLLFQGPKGELSYIIGYTQIGVIIFSLYLLWKKKVKNIEKKKTIFYLVAIGISLFLMLSLSEMIWNSFPILRNFQFTYRLSLFVALFTAFLAAIVALKIPHKLVWLLCAFAIVQTILNWGNRRTISSINDTALRKELPTSTATWEGFQPAAPKWTDYEKPWQTTIPQKHLEVIKNKAQITDLKRTTTKHEYVVTVMSDSAVLKENTIYFPNWTVKANNNILPITYNNPKYPGIMLFELPKGKHSVVVQFENTPVRMSAQWISATTFLFLVIYVIFHKWHKPKIKKKRKY